jgi:hypothetical protein
MTCIPSSERPLLWHEECQDSEVAIASAVAAVCIPSYELEHLNVFL